MSAGAALVATRGNISDSFYKKLEAFVLAITTVLIGLGIILK